jgi:hypothetical protein
VSADALLAWTLLAVRLGSSAAAQPQGVAPRQITASERGAFEASFAPLQPGAGEETAMLGEAFAVAWFDTRHGGAEIYYRLLGAEGQALSTEVRLTDGAADAFEPDIVAIGNDVAIAWYEGSYAQLGSAASDALAARLYTTRVGRWDRAGRQRFVRTLATRARVPALGSFEPSFDRSFGQRLFVAWIGTVDGAREGSGGSEAGAGAASEWLHAVWLDADGEPLAPIQRVAPASAQTWNLNVAIDALGDAWIVFDAAIGTRAPEIFLARVGKVGGVGGGAADVAVTRLTADDGHASLYPDLALGEGGGAAITWFDERDGNREVYLFVGPFGAARAGIEAAARRITVTPGESIGAYVAWNRQTVGLAWSDEVDGRHEIFFQEHRAMGAPSAPSVRITHNSSDSLIPAIHPWRDGFALIWNEMRSERSGHDPAARSELSFVLMP